MSGSALGLRHAAVGAANGAEVVGWDAVVDHRLAAFAEDEGSAPEGLTNKEVVNDVGRAEVPAEDLEGPEDRVIQDLVLFQDGSSLDVRIVTVGRHNHDGGVAHGVG